MMSRVSLLGGVRSGCLRILNRYAMRSRPSQGRGRQGFLPEVLGLEERTMLASGHEVAEGLVAGSGEQDPTSGFVSAITTLLSEQPLGDRFVNQLERGLHNGRLTRELAIRRILRTPQHQEGLVQGLTEHLLDRAPTAAETRRLVGGMQASRADLPWVFYQIMQRPEFFRDSGGTNAGFVQAATENLLHRPATSTELTRIVSRLDRGAAPARQGFLRDLINSREFHLAQTQFTHQNLTGRSITSGQQAFYQRAFRGPLGYSHMVARVMGSDTALPWLLDRYTRLTTPPIPGEPVELEKFQGASLVPVTAQAPAETPEAPVASSSSWIVPTLEENPGLTVKRVPGFLAGPKFGNVATPYNLANISGRQIDDATVDYWAVTLNAIDTVLLTISPVDNKPASDIAIRIWGPDNKEIGTALAGPQVTYVAAASGTYIIGISTAANTGYAFDPQGTQPPPSGPSLRSYTAEFSTYPGTNTSLLGILQTYTNPNYTDDNWPGWTPAQATAYATLTTIATAGSQQPGSGLENFTDFRQVGDVTDTATIAGWLTNTWRPFQTILGDPNNPEIIAISYGQVYHAYTLAQWTTIADAFLNDPTTQAAYTSVHELLAAANEDRSNLAAFLTTYNQWAMANQVNLLGDASSIAGELQTGLTQLNMSQAGSKQTFWNDLLAIFAKLAGTAGGAIGGPAGAAVASATASTIADFISAWLAGDFAKSPPPPTPINLDAAAQDIQNFSQDAFFNAFQLLTNTSFLTSMFSNYGLLEATGTIQFSYSAGDKITPANILRQAYDASVWAQLLPRMFSWKNLSFTDASSMPNFTNFFPSQETARWDNPSNLAPCECKPIISKCWWDGYCDVAGNFSFGDAVTAATPQLQALQNGASSRFPGYDPSGNNWGPGPISGARTVSGNPSRFYALTTNSTLEQAVQRVAVGRFNPYTGIYNTKASISGVTIQEWALLTADNKEISPIAAAKLFGAIPPGGLVPTGPNPKTYTGGLFVDYQIPQGGLVTRFEAFSQWGQGVNGFSPYSFQPAGASGSSTIPLNPNNQYSQYLSPLGYSNATFKITYGS